MYEGNPMVKLLGKEKFKELVEDMIEEEPNGFFAKLKNCKRELTMRNLMVY